MDFEMDYFERLESETHKLYEIANEARSKGFDVELETEIPLAKDLAERVEGLVGPKGIAKRIKELEKDMSREEVAFEIAAEIASQESNETGTKLEAQRQAFADQGLRTALAILTEGVVAAPLEGISGVKIKSNADGTKYVAVYFAGPIRSAGGTAAALSVLLGDKIRVATGLDRFKPTDDEIERYVEEVELYESEVTNLQYSPTPEEVRFAARSIPVEVSGEPTDQIEVSHRDLPRVETNNIRGGALLAMVEGVIQKSKKILKIAHTLELDSWEFLAEYAKGIGSSKEEENSSESDFEESSQEIDDNIIDKEELFEHSKYAHDIIGGRPVLGYPSEKGGFRLRYGRSRNTGLATMGVHPATMELLEFLAVGTQLKIERPGKGNCVVPVDSIEGPTVKLKSGEVRRLDSIADAREVKNKVAEILFLGDMLVAFGEFLRNNQLMLGACWCEEWWIEAIRNSDKYKSFDLEEKEEFNLNSLETKKLTVEEAFKITEEFNVPLHPEYTYYYKDISIKDLVNLSEWLNTKRDYLENGYNNREDLELDLSYQKRILEVIGLCHRLVDGKVIIDKDHAYSLLKTIGEDYSKYLADDYYNMSVVDIINENIDFEIKDKAPCYIGTRVGRPEKSKERLMRPAPHVLFPIGNNGGNRRLISEAAKKKKIKVEFARRECINEECRLSSFQSICPHCGSPTVIGKAGQKDINLAHIFSKASNNIGVRKVDEVKGVIGLISEDKLPEPLEKGILRAKNGVFTFKEGTIRHDSTDLPLTHFIPSEIGVTVPKLLKMGYDKDCYGQDIVSEDQIIELKVQDIVVSDNCGEYLVGVANFVDDLLERYYGMERFYNVKDKYDLIGHLIAGLAPHTSAGVLGRIVGFTKALGCYAHPYFHSAKRRNCDSDEDSVLLLLDALINFSKSYLPSTRGGSMDAPLVLSTRIDPEEIDDESHNLDIFERFPLEFFERSQESLKPSDMLDLVDNVEMHLGTDRQYHDLMFSHHTSSIHAGPKVCLYKRLGSMKEKVEAQIHLAELIRAVDQRRVVEGVLSSHFLPDIMGNSRAFSKQKVRCPKCGTKYRRMPLTGKCKCGGDLILSVSKGSVVKYLEISQNLVNRYPVSHYLEQRLEIQEFGINSLFESDKSKQSSLDVFFGK
ncbi:DNA polymerase II large subunit [Methanobrevibacter olleyae]|uniref:DNA polymerase II large subunit n=1 Tax=Methanobrevibacter olleyae TaxID=294671 RepID=A0A126QWR8_METOL|nr:DNA polymerase II large subunit [Methanobrevibacter olleyae]AMK14570.1 DNA polymerase large subunit DP2 PolD2 [Methanobrevibacter olleyae]